MRENNLLSIAKRLNKEGLETAIPSSNTCFQLLKELENELQQQQQQCKQQKKEEEEEEKSFSMNSTKQHLEKLLFRANRSFKRHQRTEETSNSNSTALSSSSSSLWKDSLKLSNKLLQYLKDIDTKTNTHVNETKNDNNNDNNNNTKHNNNNNKTTKSSSTTTKGKSTTASINKRTKIAVPSPTTSSSSPSSSTATSLSNDQIDFPKTVSEYRLRLISQKKDLFKDPPVLPPTNIIIYQQGSFSKSSKSSALNNAPTRNKQTGALTFPPGIITTHKGGEEHSKYIVEFQKVLKDFHPNLTPEEVLLAGAFGGTYFRPIVSAVTNIHYKDVDNQVLNTTLANEWWMTPETILYQKKKTLLTSTTYRESVNKYGVSCGGSLGMWESSGWITDIDPYGWFQWYCRFYNGRRTSDDIRQIQRWLKSAGPKGRFRSQLCNKILAAQTSHDDASISPVIRQTMLHWGLDITVDVLEKHRKRVRK